MVPALAVISCIFARRHLCQLAVPAFRLASHTVFLMRLRCTAARKVPWVCVAVPVCVCNPTSLRFQLLFVGSPQRPRSRLTVFGIRVNFHEFYCAVAAAGVRSRRDSCAASPPDERRLVYSPANLGCDWDPQTRAARPHIYIKEALFTRFSLHVPPAAFHSKVGNY